MCSLADIRCWPRMPVAGPTRLSNHFLGELLDGHELFKRGQCSQGIAVLLAKDRQTGVLHKMDL